MGFNQDKPESGGALASVDMRNNFIHIKNAIGKEHVWDNEKPENTTHRLDQIKGTVTSSTQRDIASGGFDYQTGSGNTYSLITHSVNGVAANTYTLQSLLQELVNRSHQHIVEKRLYNCNCDCNCNCGDGN